MHAIFALFLAAGPGAPHHVVGVPRGHVSLTTATATASAATPVQHAGIVVGKMQELNLAQVRPRFPCLVALVAVCNGKGMRGPARCARLPACPPCLSGAASTPAGRGGGPH